MKIAVLVDPHFPVPPKKYGGSERSVAYLIEGLVALGHDVTLFGSGNSSVSCRLIPCSQENIDIGHDKTLIERFLQAKKRNIQNIIQRQDEFDVVSWHGHMDALMQRIHIPVLFTIRNPLSFSATPYQQKILNKMKNVYINALSKKYMEVFKKIPYFTYIYNGLPAEKFPFSEKTEGYISFIGKFSKSKQPHLALQTAMSLNKNIVIGARLDRYGKEYFDKKCKQYMDSPLVDFRGEVTEEEKKEIFKFAEVNLHPVSFDEPFGLSVVEAGLCGTPTIAFDKGSMRELITDGVSGYIVKNVEEMIAFYPKALRLDRKKVRAHFMKFNQKEMARKYAEIFEEIIL